MTTENGLYGQGKKTLEKMLKERNLEKNIIPEIKNESSKDKKK